MQEKAAEDGWVDSGAETGGSDYSPLSSTSSELSMAELQDPFLVCVHLIADPGQGKLLQRAADAVLAWVHPELQLFRVSERASVSRSKHRHHGSPVESCQPALAVIVFLQEAYGGEEQLLMLHRALQRPPWRYHHTERVSNGRRMLPLAPCSQDFFTLSAGTPLWAVRQVHYGKEIVRFTVYCSHENYTDMVRLYKLLLQRRVAQKKEDFCFFVVYANPDMEIQLSLKRLPRGQSPLPLESAVMEVRVRDVGTLVPLLPHPCSPISEVRWQTEDYDGNKILLQVQGAHLRHHPESTSAPPTFTRSSASCRVRRHRTAPRPRVHQTPHSEDPDQPDPWRPRWGARRSGSVFSLPNLTSSCSSCSSSGPHLAPPFRLNLDALIGAEETDVDTGDKVDPGGVDLSVVSAYVKSSPPQASRSLSAPPEDRGLSLLEDTCRASALDRVQSSFSTSSTSSTLDRVHSSFSTSSTSSTLDRVHSTSSTLDRVHSSFSTSSTSSTLDRVHSSFSTSSTSSTLDRVHSSFSTSSTSSTLDRVQSSFSTSSTSSTLLTGHSGNQSDEEEEEEEEFYI